MKRRAAGVICLLSFCLVGLLPGHAVAAGTPLRGQTITNSGWLTGATGECACDTKWYTVGLRPGTITVWANLLYTSMHRAPTSTLQLWLDQGSTNLRFGENSCPRTERVCNKVVRFSTRITRAGVYYLKVKGLGGEGIVYSLRVLGGIFPLHCRHKTC